MTISKQNDILNDLQDTFEGMEPGSGYQSRVQKVLRGVRGIDDFTAADMPGLTIFRKQNRIDHTYYEGTENKLTVHIWGYTKVEARDNDYSALDMLVADVEKRLRDTTFYPYVSDTLIKDTTFYEGGAQDSFGFFDMEIEIDYLHSLGDT